MYNICYTCGYMKEETIALRIEPKLKRAIELTAKVLHISPSEWLRARMAYDVKETTSELKSQIVLEYMKGNLTKGELKELFGDFANEIDFIIDKTKKDLTTAHELAKR
jgi:hypothetical protein